MEKSIQVGNIEIRRSNVLDKEEKEQISLLVSVCNRADGTCNELFLTNEFNVYPEMPCFFRAYVEEGNTEPGLAGILIIYGDQEKMAEISAYVLPEQRGKGVFHALFHTALEYIRFFGYSELEFKTEKAYPAAGDILKKYGAVLIRKEYLMIWREKEEAAKDSGSPSVVRQAQKGDLDIMTEIQAEAFGDTPEMARRYVESSYQSGDTMLFVIETQGRCTGCCCVDTSGERAMIFGLCVAADFRGKGLGGQLLRESVKKAADKKGEVSLCVEAENKNALHLYESCGFREATEYRYFGCPVAVIDR